MLIVRARQCNCKLVKSNFHAQSARAGTHEAPVGPKKNKEIKKRMALLLRLRSPHDIAEISAPIFGTLWACIRLSSRKADRFLYILLKQKSELPVGHWPSSRTLRSWPKGRSGCYDSYVKNASYKSTKVTPPLLIRAARRPCEESGHHDLLCQLRTFLRGAHGVLSPSPM